MSYEYMIDSYNSGFFEGKASCDEKMKKRLKELDILGWEVISIYGFYDWRIVSRRPRG